MKCDEVQSWICGYVDDTLPPEHRGPMFTHLASCSTCQRFFETVLRIRAVASTMPTELPPESVDRFVQESLRTHTTTRIIPMSPWSVRVSVPLPAAVAMAVLLIVGSSIVLPVSQVPPLPRERLDIALENMPASVRATVQIANTMISE